MGWLVPKSVRRVSMADVERALIENWGNVSLAARALGVPTEDLRAVAWRIPDLVEAMVAGIEQALDEAEAEVLAAIRTGSQKERVRAAGWLLTHSPAGKRRGWGRGVPPPPEDVNMAWD